VSDNALQLAIRQLAFGASLTVAEASEAFGVIMRGEATPAQVAHQGGPSTRCGRPRLRSDGAPEPRTALVDTCGTGGGSITTFSISTAAALLAAGLGVRGQA
jgi:anthranilate phosphoribosyltransferase